MKELRRVGSKEAPLNDVEVKRIIKSMRLRPRPQPRYVHMNGSPAANPNAVNRLPGRS